MGIGRQALKTEGKGGGNNTGVSTTTKDYPVETVCLWCSLGNFQVPSELKKEGNFVQVWHKYGHRHQHTHTQTKTQTHTQTQTHTHTHTVMWAWLLG